MGGSGIYLTGGNGHTIQDVVANGRQYGVYGIGATLTNLTIKHLFADAASHAGLFLNLGSAPLTPVGGANVLTLEDLRLTNCVYGLRLQNFVGTAANRYVIDNFKVTDLSGSLTGIYLADGGVKYVTFTRSGTSGYWALKHQSYGINGAAGSNDNLRFEHLDVSGFGSYVSSNGLYLAGTNLVVDDVIANDRAAGVYLLANSYSNVSISNLRAARASGAGLYLGAVTLSGTNTLTLSNLQLTDSQYGLQMNGVVGVAPTGSGLTATFTQILDPTMLTDLSGNGTAIYLQDSVKNIKVKDFTGTKALKNVVAGINAAGTSNNTLAFENLDVSGVGNYGKGLAVGGTNITIKDVTANHRTNGVYASSAPGIKIDHLTATWCNGTEGALYLHLGGGAAPTLTSLVLNHSRVGLYIASSSLAWTLGSGVGLDVSDCDSSIEVIELLEPHPAGPDPRRHDPRHQSPPRPTATSPSTASTSPATASAPGSTSKVPATRSSGSPPTDAATVSWLRTAAASRSRGSRPPTATAVSSSRAPHPPSVGSC